MVLFKQSTAFQVSPLQYWALLGKVDQVLGCLNDGEDPNVSDPDGYSALHAAAENGHLPIVRLLLDRGARPHPTTNDGLTPLDLAEMLEHDDVARILLNLE